MPVKRDGRRVLAKVTGATSMPSPSAKKDIGVSHSTLQTAKVNAVASRKTPVRFPIRASDAAAWLAFFLLTAAGLLALCILATIVWPS